MLHLRCNTLPLSSNLYCSPAYLNISCGSGNIIRVVTVVIKMTNVVGIEEFLESLKWIFEES
jgi:hypothetical protein